MTAAAPIATDLQYRVYLSAGSKSFPLKYASGKASGIKGLKVLVSGNDITFTFPRSSTGLPAGGSFTWYGEVQGGIPGQPNAGKLDRMPNVGTFSYTLH
jgi:hypothetical protein